jgi:DNA-binding SARP family transcriptional activator
VTLEFQVLGGIHLRDGDRDDLASILARPKRLALLAYLCLEGADGPVRRDTLLPVFWPESDEAHARAALNQALHVLRSALGADVVATRGRDEVGIDFAFLRCDAVAFRRALASDDRRTALDLYAGDLLPGFHIGEPGFDRWLEEERTALRIEALNAALALGAAAGAAEDRDEAVAVWRRAREIAPDSEAAARGLVLALWSSGRRSAALEAYESFAERLALDYGVAPGPGIETVLDRIRAGVPPVAGSPSPLMASSLPEPSPPIGEEAGPDASASSGARRFDRETRYGSSRGSGSRRPTPAWLRVALPFGLGIGTIVAIGMWTSRTPAAPEVVPFDAEVEYGRAWAAWLGGERFDSVRLHAARAIEADSGHARAWALLAYADILLTTHGDVPARALLPEAFLAARRAVELDDTLAAAWQAMATAEWIQWHWESAERSYRRALSMRTRGAWEALTRADLSALLVDLGRCEEAREVLEPYGELEPAARPLRSALVVRVPYLCREWDAAIRAADRSVAGGDSSFAVLRYRFLARLLAGDAGGASTDLAEMRAALGPGPALDGLEALLLARRGDTTAARRIISALAEDATAGDPFAGAYGSFVEPLAQLYAAVGDRDGAFGLLTSEMDRKTHVRRLSSDPLFDPLRDDPRFDALLARMGLICRRANGRQVCQVIE